MGYIESLEKRLSMMESLLSTHVGAGGVPSELAAMLAATEADDELDVPVKQEAGVEAVQMQAALKRARAAGTPAPSATGSAASTRAPKPAAARSRGRPQKQPAEPQIVAPVVETIPLNDIAIPSSKPSRAAARGAGSGSGTGTVPPGTISPGAANTYTFSVARRRSAPVVYNEHYVHQDHEDHEDHDEQAEGENGYALSEPRDPASPYGPMIHLDHDPHSQYHPHNANGNLTRHPQHVHPPVPASESGSTSSDPTTREPPFGENEVIMPLITLFFSHAYPLMPIIHRWVESWASVLLICLSAILLTLWIFNFCD